MTVPARIVAVAGTYQEGVEAEKDGAAAVEQVLKSLEGRSLDQGCLAALAAVIWKRKSRPRR